jgi:tripartite-type tricarboxylate transporter receptor subunit TctC
MFIAIGIGAFALAPVAARSYPEHSVRIIVPFPAGGPLDVVARALADKLAAKLKQPFIVENKPGAGATSEPMPRPRPRPTVTRCYWC